MRQQYLVEKNPDFWNDVLLGPTYSTKPTVTVYQKGSGFVGIPYQRGAGFGSWFRGFFRTAVPMFKKAAVVVGKEAMAAGASAVRDIARGEPVKDSVTKYGKEAIANLADKAVQKLREDNRPEIGTSTTEDAQTGGSISIIPAAKTTVPVVRKRKISSNHKKNSRKLKKDIFD